MHCDFGEQLTTKNSLFLATKFNANRFRANYAWNCVSYRKHQANSGGQVSASRTDDWPAEFPINSSNDLSQNFERYFKFSENDNEFCWELQLKNCHIQNHKEIGISVGSAHIFIFAFGLNPSCLSFVSFFKTLFPGFSTCFTKNKETVFQINFPN